MSSLPIPTGASRLAVLPDEELVDRLRAGDEAAFAALHTRYEARMIRYARRVLGGSHQVAEDVVQEALWRAHRALCRDDRPIALRPWLYRLVRNCCLDEFARGRNDALDLHALSEEPAALDADPSIVAEQRRRTRDLLGDLAALPADQRHALVRREIDGLSHAGLARELGLTEQATRSLVHRARRNLVKAADARDAACEDVREDLDLALDEGRRAAARTYRHLATCRGCRAYRAELRRVGTTLRLLLPAPALLTLGAGALLVSKGTKLGSAAAVSTVLAGGAIGATQVFGPGDPSPVSSRSDAAVLLRGVAIPPGTAVASRVVAVPAEGQTVAARLTCPEGTAAAELLPPRPRRLSFGMTGVPGASRTAVVRIAGDDAITRATIRVLCKRPDARGSLLASPVAFAAAAPAAITTTCRDRTYLLRSPRGAVSASTFRSQPLVVLKRRDGWARVRADSGETGWLRATRLCG